MLEIDNPDFDGMNGCVNERPYIVINKNMTSERIRTTIGHEIAHFAFQWPEDMSDKEIENYAAAIVGAFLFPEEDIVRELGVRRRAITTDMLMVCKEYGISMPLLAERARLCKIISDFVYELYITRSGRNEGSSITIMEVPTLFEELVYRAVNEGEISIQKGAELLKMPYDQVADNCRVVGV